MRNRLIHGYFDINTEIVWKTVSEELPALLIKLRKKDIGQVSPLPVPFFNRILDKTHIIG